MKSYLVRAAYSGIGEYTVSFLGTNLFVHHGSLGKGNEFSKSALVVCLADTPKNLYVSLSKVE